MERLAGIAATVMDVAGIVAVLGGMALSVGPAVLMLRRSGIPAAYRSFRAGVGGAILLGLEFLVGADILRTVTGVPDLQSLAVLGGIVAIRTVLSFTLDVELRGTWPWKRGPTSAASSGSEPVSS